MHSPSFHSGKMTTSLERNPLWSLPVSYHLAAAVALACSRSRMLKSLCLRPPGFAVGTAIPKLLLSLSPPPASHPFHITVYHSLFSSCAKDSTPAAICIDLDPRGIAPFYFSTWFLVATASVQGASLELTKLQMWFNSDSLGEKKTPTKIYNCFCPLHRPWWARCELPPYPANWSPHPKLWG